MVDLESFLLPISAERPTGVDLRLIAGDTTFRRLGELRREVDSTLDPEGQGRSADWPAVLRECGAALRERSKDLELAATLTQALARTEGFPGLAAGLRLIRELIDRYWDTLYPGCDEDGIELAIRARPLAWLGASRDFLNAVKQIPVAGAPGDALRSWFDYEQSRRVDEAALRSDRQQYQELIDAGLITGEQWRTALGRTPPDRLAALREAIAACAGELVALGEACEQKFGSEAPHLLDLRNLLEACQAQLDQAGGGEQPDDGAVAAAMVGALPGASLAAGGGAATAATAAGPIATREQAYRQLRVVAEFLRRTEPHSPVALLIERAVKWGDLPFESLFRDFVKNEDVRGQVQDLLGLQPPRDA
jgi:type VI secretion system protein ImpA